MGSESWSPSAEGFLRARATRLENGCEDKISDSHDDFNQDFGA